VQGALDDPRVHVVGQQGQRGNADPVFKHGDRDDAKGQDRASPPGLEEQVARQKGRDEERQSRPDPAALGGHLDAEARQVETEAFPHIGRLGNPEQKVCKLRRALLQKDNQRIHRRIGEGDYKNEKQQGKQGGLESLHPVGKEESSPENDQRRCRQNGRAVRKIKVPAE